MGKNNKARRAAKAKGRRTRGPSQPRRDAWPGDRAGGSYGERPAPDPRLQVAAAWYDLETAVRVDRPDADDAAGRLASLPAPLVCAAGEETISEMLAALWAAGWQPAELRRQVRRAVGASAARMVEVAILAFHERLDGVALDPRWSAQLREFSQRHVSTSGGWLANWRREEALTLTEACRVMAVGMVEIASLPRIDLLIPAPGVGSSPVGVRTSSVNNDPMLRRIRGLLAKAESTEFEEEASALTAKAQELITRHAVDQALVGEPEPDDVPRMARVPVDAPYADAKSVLLSVVAHANRSRTVMLGRLGMSTVVGHADDLALVEMLFTSLLVQAQNALTDAGRAGGYGARARRPGFRQSFFLGFTDRISERLDGVNADVLAGTGATSEALPVLRARQHAVDEFLSEHYGDTLTSAPVRGGYDYAGAAVGRRAADQAKLDSGELLW